MDNVTVYSITEKSTGMVYVGQTTNIEERCYSDYGHFHNEEFSHPYLYGKDRDDFDIEILEESVPYEHRYLRETYWICKLNSFSDTNPLGLNKMYQLMDGTPIWSMSRNDKIAKARTGTKHTQESLDKMSIRAKQRMIDNPDHHRLMCERSVTPEARRKKVQSTNYEPIMKKMLDAVTPEVRARAGQSQRGNNRFLGTELESQWLAVFDEPFEVREKFIQEHSEE